MRASTAFEELCAPVLAANEVELWAIRTLEGPKTTLQVLIDKEGGVNIDDCARVSRGISMALDAADSMAGPFNLEVSSPGMARPLIEPRHFAWAVGKNIELTLKAHPERKRYQGKLAKANEQEIILEDEDTSHTFELDNIAKAKVLID